MRRLTTALITTALASIAGHVFAQAPEDKVPMELRLEEPTADTEWFEDAKFGMFVHWGISSGTGGHWQDQNWYGITEWLWRRSEASREDYLALLNDFNPTAFDADAWTDLAKDAGAGYMVVTAKHHDGVAMFDTDASPYDIVDGAPFGRDPLAELASAASEKDIKLGFYYSQFQDWEHPHAGGNAWEYDSDEQDYDIYLREKALPQIDELLTNYGDVALVWFDTPGNSTEASAREFIRWVRERQPATLVSSRIGHGLGDYRNYRDSEIPVIHRSPRPFEAIFPHNETWGYSDLDTNFKSTTELVHIMVEVASKGGNFLLNVGPDGDGRIPQESQDRLREFGVWLRENGGAIYETEASPFAQVPWGGVTQKDGKVFLLVTEPPESGPIYLPGMTERVTSAHLLGSRKRLNTKSVRGGLNVDLPRDGLPDSRASVIVLEHKGGLIPEVEDGVRYTSPLSMQYDALVLEPNLATFTGDVVNKDYRYWLNFGEWKHYPSVDQLNKTTDKVSWSIDVREAGTYSVKVSYTADETEAGQEALVEIGNRPISFRVLETGPLIYDRPAPILDHIVGTVTLEEGLQTLTLRPMQDGANILKLRSVALVPHE